MADGVRYLNREMADEMCNQASLDSMREQHYKDSVEIERLRAEVERLRKQRDHHRLVMQGFLGQVYRAAERADKEARRALGEVDGG